MTHDQHCSIDATVAVGHAATGGFERSAETAGFAATAGAAIARRQRMKAVRQCTPCVRAHSDRVKERHSAQDERMIERSHPSRLLLCAMKQALQKGSRKRRCQLALAVAWILQAERRMKAAVVDEKAS